MDRVEKVNQSGSQHQQQSIHKNKEGMEDNDLHASCVDSGAEEDMVKIFDTYREDLGVLSSSKEEDGTAGKESPNESSRIEGGGGGSMLPTAHQHDTLGSTPLSRNHDLDSIPIKKTNLSMFL